MSNYLLLPLQSVVILVVVLLSTGLLLYGLLKIHSRIMNRVGPMYAGRFHGVGQPIAEFLKPIQKEDIVPDSADKRLFKLAPYLPQARLLRRGTPQLTTCGCAPSADSADRRAYARRCGSFL